MRGYLTREPCAHQSVPLQRIEDCRFTGSSGREGAGVTVLRWHPHQVEDFHRCSPLSNSPVNQSRAFNIQRVASLTCQFA